MGNPDRALSLVHMLSSCKHGVRQYVYMLLSIRPWFSHTCTLATHGSNFQIGRIDFDVRPLSVVVKIWGDTDTSKRGMPRAVGIEGRRSHQTVHTGLKLRVPVGKWPVNQESGGLDACYISRRFIDHLHCIYALSSDTSLKGRLYAYLNNFERAPIWCTCVQVWTPSHRPLCRQSQHVYPGTPSWHQQGQKAIERPESLERW